MSEQFGHLINRAYDEVKKYKELVLSDPYRLSYHLMPSVGFLNDPNGLIQYKGFYHVFYQWNPFGTMHGSKFWGHFSSPDLVHWQEEPIALAPTEWYDKDGCYSGSAVCDDGHLYLIYTGNVKGENGERETYQCLAVSTDGVNFEKKGPILRVPEGYTTHFRDPKVWKHEGQWYMILGAQNLEEKGSAVLFTSPDLYQWEMIGGIAGAGINGLEELGYMWECPDLFPLNDQHILLISPQSLIKNGEMAQELFQSGYFNGEFLYETHQFKHGPFKLLDYGFDFYAPQTFKDIHGRTILFGWMGITNEIEQLQPTIPNKWLHALTMPRELQWRNGRIFQRPLEELQLLRNNEVLYKDIQMKQQAIQFEGIQGTSAELFIEFSPRECHDFQIDLRHEARLTYDDQTKEVTLYRRNIDNSGEQSRKCKIEGLSNLHFFMDESSIEIFINDGGEVMTARYFPKPEDHSITFEGDATFSITKWDLLQHKNEESSPQQELIFA